MLVPIEMQIPSRSDCPPHQIGGQILSALAVKKPFHTKHKSFTRIPRGVATLWFKGALWHRKNVRSQCSCQM